MITNAPERAELARIPTGIPGLDEMIEKGFPFPSVILVSGSAGTGKTTFALRFLCEGAARGEQGLYFTTLSEPTQWMLRFSSQFDFMKPEYFDNEIVYEDLGDHLRSGDSDKLIEVIEKRIAEVVAAAHSNRSHHCRRRDVRGELSSVPFRLDQQAQELERYHRSDRRGSTGGAVSA